MSVLGFIGTGTMGSALAKAAAKKQKNEILLANRTFSKAEALAEELGAKAVDNETVARSADFIFLCVKPYMMEEMLQKIAAVLKSRQNRFILVDIAGGTTISKIREYVGADYPVIRIIPNTPCAIGKGIVLYDYTEDVESRELDCFLNAMEAAGYFSRLEEKLIDVGSSITGCGPAFLDLFVEALADGGVACGLPRALAIEYAARMCIGAGSLILESGKHPGALKDAVCSPGGTTIQGIRTLEKGGFRSAVTEAVIVSYEKNF